jgi:hypothetical protein
MDSQELIKTTDFPKPPARKAGRPGKLAKERAILGLEAAAIAYVQMEFGEYRYPPEAKRQYDADGAPTPNKREVMRRAGYATGSLDHFDDYLAPRDDFWHLVELHRLRRTDPMFRKEHESRLWQALGGEALRNLYEKLFYYPHSLTTEQHIKIVKLILDAGITLQKLGGEKPNKTAELLSTIDEEKRSDVMKGYKEKLLKDLEELESIEKAHKGADRE